MIHVPRSKKYIPIESYSHVSGLLMKHTWEFKSIVTMTYESERSANDNVTGTLKWHLFGFNIYNEPKRFHGKIE